MAEDQLAASGDAIADLYVLGMEGELEGVTAIANRGLK
jgi:hypothetical protein